MDVHFALAMQAHLCAGRRFAVEFPQVSAVQRPGGDDTATAGELLVDGQVAVGKGVEEGLRIRGREANRL